MNDFELSFTIHKNNGLRALKQTSHVHNIRQNARALQMNPRRQWLVKGNAHWIGTMKTDSAVQYVVLATFRLQYEDDYEYEFSVLSTRFRFGGRKFSKCACSELKTRSHSRPRTPI